MQIYLIIDHFHWTIATLLKSFTEALKAEIQGVSVYSWNEPYKVLKTRLCF